MGSGGLRTGFWGLDGPRHWPEGKASSQRIRKINRPSTTSLDGRDDMVTTNCTIEIESKEIP
jgi:hypothetical protein